MKYKLGLLIFVVSIVFISIFYSTTQGEDIPSYVQSVEKKRSEQQDFLKNNENSPFVKSKTDYKPLSFYPVDINYKVEARIEKIKKYTEIKTFNSDQSQTVYLKYAWLQFEIKGVKCKLLALKNKFLPRVFLSFTDKTNGNATYGGGRYLDIENVKGDWLTLDFNLAYNPYCAYVSSYLCPLPPEDNFLDVEIEAGEKLF